ADDLAQETLLKAYEASTRYIGSDGHSTWLRRIALRCYLNSRRGLKAANTQLSIEKATHLDSGQNTDAAFQYEELYLAIGSLSDTERTALLLHYMEDRPIQEIAIIMNVAEGTVKSNLSRGREHLRLKLKR
ncbi:MAG: RNA polymerase sigma factor, partial [Bacteroidales bacterium]|nr:RNA polymerase sigma factor [Bacteroidales bacterium]